MQGDLSRKCRAEDITAGNRWEAAMINGKVFHTTGPRAERQLGPSKAGERVRSFRECGDNEPRRDPIAGMG